MRHLYPYEITKLYDTKINPKTGKKEIVLKKDYAYAIDQNFKAIQKHNPTFQFLVPATLVVGYPQAPNIPVPFSRIAKQLYAYVNIAPSCNDVIIRVYKNASLFGTVTIPIGSNTGQTEINKNLLINDVLSIYIYQADGVATRLTLQIRT